MRAYATLRSFDLDQICCACPNWCARCLLCLLRFEGQEVSGSSIEKCWMNGMKSAPHPCDGGMLISIKCRHCGYSLMQNPQHFRAHSFSQLIHCSETMFTHFLAWSWEQLHTISDTHECAHTNRFQIKEKNCLWNPLIFMSRMCCAVNIRIITQISGWNCLRSVR